MVIPLQSVDGSVWSRNTAVLARPWSSCRAAQERAMDGSRFDAFSRLLAEPGSRRRAFGAAFAGGLGLTLLSVGQGAVAKKKKPCPPCKKRKKGKCKGLLPDGSVCAGGTCQGGSCLPTGSPPSPPAS